MQREILDLAAWGIAVFEEFGRYNYATVQQKLPAHTHPDAIEICYLFKGCQVYVDGTGSRHEVHGGELFIAYPDECHGTGECPEGKGVLYWFSLRRPCCGQPFLNLTYDEALEMFRMLENIPHRVFRADSQTGSLFRKVFEVCARPVTVFNTVELKNLLVALTLNILRCSMQSADGDVSDRSGMEVVKAYIAENICEPVDLEELAGLVSLSLSRFKHRFKEEVGLPPAEYILRQKIEKAKELLGKQMPVCDVAYRLNFSSPAHFSSVFRKYEGCTPTDFQNG